MPIVPRTRGARKVTMDPDEAEIRDWVHRHERAQASATSQGFWLRLIDDARVGRDERSTADRLYEANIRTYAAKYDEPGNPTSQGLLLKLLDDARVPR